MTELETALKRWDSGDFLHVRDNQVVTLLDAMHFPVIVEAARSWASARSIAEGGGFVARGVRVWENDPESLFLVRRVDGEPIDDNLFYMAKDWDEALSIAGELIGGEWGYGDGTEYEVLEAKVTRSITIAIEEEE
jgi:hypothetical protein